MTRAILYKKIVKHFTTVEVGYFTNVILKGGDKSFIWEAYGYLRALMIYSDYFSMEEVSYFIEIAIDSIYS